MQKILQQSIIVENQPGAAGTIAASYVARFASDSYTLLVGDVALVTAPHLMKRVHYRHRLDKDFEPISPLTPAPLVLTVPQRSPVQNLPQLITSGKKSANGLTLSSAGVGSTPHLSGELLKIKKHWKLYPRPL